MTVDRSALLLVMALALGCRQPDPGAGAETSGSLSGSLSASSPPPVVTAGPTVASAAQPVEPWLDRILRASDPRWSGWLEQAEALRLQILVTVVSKTGPWQTHALRVDAEYFYPASAIKTFLAVAALRTLSRKVGGEVPLGSRIIRCAERRPGCEPPKEDEDPDQPAEEEKRKHNPKLRVGDEIRKMLSYSDNDSYNRLYDIVGHAELNEEMRAMGFDSVRFHHRMSAPAEESRLTPRVVVRPPGKAPLEFEKRTSTFAPLPTPATGLGVGTAYRDRTGLVEKPLDFANKNYASLRDLQRINVSLLFPERPEAADLGLTEAQRAHVVSSMTASFKNRKHAAEHSPLVPGIVDAIGDEGVRYVAKSGRAYGFHLENAFIEHKASGRAFFVTVTVYSNPDGVMNDDDYGYDEVTRPLLASLGAALAKELLGGDKKPDAAAP
ncbi:MAG: serine hydrolase [Myxococcales bacterium]|nr:serine hydrolase [Myxococcales bacterium]